MALNTRGTFLTLSVAMMCLLRGNILIFWILSFLILICFCLWSYGFSRFFLFLLRFVSFFSYLDLFLSFLIWICFYLFSFDLYLSFFLWICFFLWSFRFLASFFSNFALLLSLVILIILVLWFFGDTFINHWRFV